MEKEKKGNLIRKTVSYAAIGVLGLTALSMVLGIGVAKNAYINHRIDNMEADNDKFTLPAANMQKHGLSGLSILEKFNGACSDAAVTEVTRSVNGNVVVTTILPVGNCRVPNAPKYQGN